MQKALQVGRLLLRAQPVHSPVSTAEAHYSSRAPVGRSGHRTGRDALSTHTEPWQPVKDKNTGEVYWWNTRTGIVLELVIESLTRKRHGV